MEFNKHLTSYPILIVENDSTYEICAPDFDNLEIACSNISDGMNQIQADIERITWELSNKNLPIPTPSVPDREIENASTQLFVEVAKRYSAIPQTIYYYCGVEAHFLKMLTEPYLWFSKPSKYNDPYELPSVVTNEWTTDELWREALFVYNFNTTLSQHIRKKFDDAQHFFAHCQLNDVDLRQYLVGIRYEVSEKVTNSFSLSCLSRYHDQVLMWSHYANKHSGLVIGFDTKKILEDDSNDIFGSDVDYRWHPTKIRLGDLFGTNPSDLTQPYYTRRLVTKHPMWAYEQEFRLLNTTGYIGEYKIDPSAIREIYIGANMDEECESKVREHCKHLGIAPMKTIACEDYVLRFN